ncbi:hypothetical protein [Cobetia marina]|uniref:hypothetical protein n=1 Tax=Cobetia marina TaxID=28258 RepID=UPI0011427A95|nr:hypothetical protein [Cobetia marina]GED41224.1 hypothetical protein HHA02_05530 [Cobetia marina]
MYSRESYVNHRTPHHDYYVQFVGPEEMDKVEDVIGYERILSSTDYHFNDIPDDEWDCLGIAPTYLERAPLAGDSPSDRGRRCVFKAAARLIRMTHAPILPWAIDAYLPGGQRTRATCRGTVDGLYQRHVIERTPLHDQEPAPERLTFLATASI